MSDRLSVLPAVSLEAAPNPLQAEFIEVKNPGPKGPKPQEGDKGKEATPQVDVGDKLFNQVLSIKPNEIGQGFRDAQAAAQKFMTVADKGEALKQGAPAFEAAIAKSDSEYISAIAKYSPDYNEKRSAVRDKQTKLVISMEGLKQAVGSVPEDKKESVSHLIALASDDTISPALKANLRKELDKYPGLLKSFDSAETAINAEAKAEEAMVKAAAPLMQAAREQAATRYIYAHAMELAGEGAKAYLLKQEGKTKMNDAAFEFLDAPKPPSHILKA
ncbi:MAG: hypothetical protein JST01_01495 [Cyanobacteria bacterium SZAS TMP-1]|nr:hypothetical protein [Cyanobacteria bacterium SZAS TMP-1]